MTDSTNQGEVAKPKLEIDGYDLQMIFRTLENLAITTGAQLGKPAKQTGYGMLCERVGVFMNEIGIDCHCATNLSLVLTESDSALASLKGSK